MSAFAQLSERIRRIAYKLEFHRFLDKERRIRLREELFELLDKRDSYLEHQKTVFKEKIEKLKDSNEWKNRFFSKREEDED